MTESNHEQTDEAAVKWQSSKLNDEQKCRIFQKITEPYHRDKNRQEIDKTIFPLFLSSINDPVKFFNERICKFAYKRIETSSIKLISIL